MPSAPTVLSEMIKSSKTFEVLDYHDGPWLQSVMTKTGHLMIAMNYESADGLSRWLYVDVSHDKYSAVRGGRLSLYEAFKDAESGFVYRCTAMNSGVETEIVACSSIEDRVLPDQSWRLSIGELSLPPKEKTAKEAVDARRRQILDLAISPPQSSALLSARNIADTIAGVQLLVEALALDQSKGYVRVPSESKADSTLYITGLYAGSFGMRFEMPESSMFALPESEFAAARFSSLIELFDAPESLVAEFEKLNLLSRARFMRFLRLLSERDLSISYEWASVRGYFRSGSVALTRLRQNLAYLDAKAETSSRTVSRTGFLDMVNVTSGAFSFVDDIGEKIKGRIDRKLLDEVVSRRHQVFPVPWRTTIEVFERVTSNQVTGAETWVHTMVGIKNLPEIDSGSQ